ncbi:MAG: cupin domain-containing protein [Chitinophagaceae bacterium]
MDRIQHLIAYLHLQPHPEGGYYAETYRSTETLPRAALPARFTGSRNYSTAIYFLIPAGQFSAFPRIRADELWHFYEGGPLHVYVIDPGGSLQIIRLGGNITDGEVFQAIVPAGCWFASRPAPDTSYSLVGCTVAPGFDFEDFEMADGTKLTAKYPSHAGLIAELCRT